MSQPLPEHGVYTVFVELDNTKLEVRAVGFELCWSIDGESCVGECMLR